MGFANRDRQKGLVMKNISAEEFEALRPTNSDHVVVERDTEYSYEIFVNEDGDEIAFASHHSFKPSTYVLRDENDGNADA